LRTSASAPFWKASGLTGGEIHAQSLVLLEVNMALLSRSFVRNRLISLATTLSVSASSFALAQDPTSAHHIRATAADFNEQQFLFDNDLAMSSMTRGMLVTPTGNVDRDFEAMMIPHHQGAVEMARAELKYGHNEELRRLAQNIVTRQEQEISVMRRAIGRASPTQAGGAPVQQSGTALGPASLPAAMSSTNID
jgi:hypothetical protein